MRRAASIRAAGLTRGLLWAAPGLAGAALVALFSVWAPPDDPLWSTCVFRRVLGIPCPGCGLTRGVAALVRGDLAAALAYHPAAPVLAAEAALLWVLWGTALLRRRPLPALLRRRGDWLLLAHGAALVALWTGRLATGTLPW